MAANDINGNALAVNDLVVVMFGKVLALGTDFVQLQLPNGPTINAQSDRLEKIAGTSIADAIAIAFGSPAPSTAEYLVGALDATLTNERLVTDTATATWDLTVAGQAKVDVPAGAVVPAPHAASHQDGGADEVATAVPAANAIPKADGTGTLAAGWIPSSIATDAEVAAAIAAHAGAADPHPTYTTAAELTTAITNHEAAVDPHTGYQKESEKGAANGYAGLNASTKVSGTQQTYGASANTACEGNDGRLSDARAPTGAAGGDLTGTYPNPTIGALKVLTAAINTGAVTDAKLRNSSACSVIGRTFNSIGAPADIVAANNNEFLMRRSNQVVFGPLVANDLSLLREVDLVGNQSIQSYWRDDFIPGRQSWYDSTGSGGVVGMTETTFSGQTDERPGNMRVSGGATVGGYAHAYTNPTSFILGSGWTLEMRISLLGTLTSTTARLGWGDATAGADVTDGAYFEYLPGTSANWFRCTAQNNTRTKTDSGTAVATGSGTYVTLKIVWNSDTSVEFFVNGVSVGSNTANLPTASGRDCGIHYYIINQVLNGFATIDVDWVHVHKAVSR